MVPFRIDPGDISGVVTSPKGLEAGVWVIAEPRNCPPSLSRLLLPTIKDAICCRICPRPRIKCGCAGYGLVDSAAVPGTPGNRLNLAAVVAPTPKDAAQYYPAVYWLSLIKVPDKSEFPMKATPMPPYKGQTAGLGPSIWRFDHARGAETRQQHGQPTGCPKRRGSCAAPDR